MAFAQVHDSILVVMSNNTVLKKSIVKADSIAQGFQFKADSLNTHYQRQFAKIQSIGIRLQSKMDSLLHDQLPVDKLTNKMDSLQRIMEDHVNSLHKKTEELKSKVTESLNEIQLPPPFQENLQKLQSSIQNYKLPSLTKMPGELPKLELPASGQWQLPSISRQLNLGMNSGNIGGINENVKELIGDAGKYGQEAQQLLNSNIGDLGNMEKVMEGKLLNMEGAEQLKEGNALLKQMEQVDSATVTEKANEMMNEVIVKAAKDHFAGKQEVLQKAMNDMMKLKNKYEEVQSMTTLPKRMPNPLRGKPFIERFFPAITFQVLKMDYFLLDINPMLMYHIRQRVIMGIGWNQRFPLDGWSMIDQETVYGPRAALEFRWKKGINFRLLPEFMNTTIPELIAQAKGVDISYREWVKSVFVGIRKDYTVYKKIKGNTEVLYNLVDPDGLSPYGDRLSLRFGFDFPMNGKKRN